MRHLIIGAGIVGLAIARELQRTHPGSEVVVLDKEPHVAAHQTGHNSGVVHAGVYYPPGSLKATLCRRGVRLLRDYTEQRNLPYDEVGKVVVAVDAQDEARLAEVHRRAVANGVPGARLIGPTELRDLEPHVVGVAALHSPTTAIVDFVSVTQALADDVTTGGGQVLLGHEVVGLRRTLDRVEALVNTPDEQVRIVADRLIIAGGLYVDRLARMIGGSPDPQIVPFRGEYHLLAPNRAHLVRGLVYPVPDPAYPFLGVHLTRRIDGTVDVGPNAVFATAREGYTHWDVNARDLGEAIAWPGMRTLARQHWRTGIAEMAGSLFAHRFADAARRYVPELSDDDLRLGSAGVRAQAVARDGSLVDDFVIEQIGPVTAIRNAPSPAATSSLAIAEHVVAHLPA